MEKKIYTVKAKGIIHTVRTYKKFAASSDEARKLVLERPETYIEEERISNQLNDAFLPAWLDDEKTQELILEEK